MLGSSHVFFSSSSLAAGFVVELLLLLLLFSLESSLSSSPSSSLSSLSSSLLFPRALSVFDKTMLSFGTTVASAILFVVITEATFRFFLKEILIIRSFFKTKKEQIANLWVVVRTRERIWRCLKWIIQN